MEELFTSLAWKCYENDLRFEYIPTSNGITIYSDDYEPVANAFDTNVSILTYLHKQVDRYLDEQQEITDEEFLVEETSNLTSYERKMKECGHKNSDFM